MLEDERRPKGAARPLADQGDTANSSNPEATTILQTDRPIVTFALFAYNQEKFIREAIEGAFSQTYQPLEIILSDDCSSDRTFEIMQEMAAAYHGPHAVRVNQNSANCGTIDHIITVARLSTGELLIVAAGDDISYPCRANTLVSAWARSGAMALYSGCDEVSEDGDVVRKAILQQPMPAIQKLFEGCTVPQRFDGKVRNIPGYSAAYSMPLFQRLPLNRKRALNEDALSTFLVNLLGQKIEVVPDALLAYRVHPNSLSVRGGADSIAAVVENEKALIRFSKSTLCFLPYFYEVALKSGSRDARSLISRLKAQERMAAIIARIWEVGIWGRLGMLAGARSVHEARSIISRMFGLTTFARMKMAVDFLRRGSD